MKRVLSAITLLLSILSVSAQGLTSTLELGEEQFIFPEIRVYLIQDVENLSDYPIIDLSDAENLVNYVLNDSVLMRSTGTKRLFDLGLNYVGDDTLEVRTMVQYKIVLRSKLLPLEEIIYGEPYKLESAKSDNGVVQLPNPGTLKPKKKEVLRLLGKLIEKSEEGSELKGMTAKQLYKQSQGEPQSLRWSLELDRLFLKIVSANRDAENQEESAIVLELEQISRP